MYQILDVRETAAFGGLRDGGEKSGGCRSNSYFVFSVTQKQPPSADCDIVEKKGFAFPAGKLGRL